MRSTRRWPASQPKPTAIGSGWIWCATPELWAWIPFPGIFSPSSSPSTIGTGTASLGFCTSVSLPPPGCSFAASIWAADCLAQDPCGGRCSTTWQAGNSIRPRRCPQAICEVSGRPCVEAGRGGPAWHSPCRLRRRKWTRHRACRLPRRAEHRDHPSDEWTHCDCPNAANFTGHVTSTILRMITPQRRLMKPLRVLLAALAFFACAIYSARALDRPDVTFKVFQFPQDKIPRIDGDPGDWAIVPDTYRSEEHTSEL